MFGSERQNVIKACDIVRHSPLIGPKIPVHGLLLDIETGKLDWVVNGYQTLDTLASRLHEPISPAGAMPDMLKSLSPFHIGEMKFPEAQNRRAGDARPKIGCRSKAGKIGAPTAGSRARRRAGAEVGGEVAKQVAEYAEKHWPQTADRAAENSHPAAHPPESNRR